MNVGNVNRSFPKYPITVQDKGWVYGVWYCGTAFTKQEIYGQHPPTYLKRLISLFPESIDWLHCPSGIIPHGKINGKNHTTVDIVSRKEGCPQIISCATDLPFPNESFDVIETDPPYGKEHEDIYGTGKYPRRKSMAEFRRLLRPGGYLCWLDVRYPSYKRGDWLLEGLICVVTGFERITRILSIFKKPHAGDV